MSEPVPPPPAAPATSSRATTALVLGILGFLCCQLCAPFAWYYGNLEVKAIKAGTSAATNQGFAMAGMILGIIGTIFLLFAVLWIVFFGGMAMLGALAGAAGN
ncbi:MAG: hypothetical protein H6Q03_2167 [Acidobacteria bacterium]|jgi:hypothetical protein|nr:hypothetical protein [Acidobacteriota bacterium]